MPPYLPYLYSADQRPARKVSAGQASFITQVSVVCEGGVGECEGGDCDHRRSLTGTRDTGGILSAVSYYCCSTLLLLILPSASLLLWYRDRGHPHHLV